MEQIMVSQPISHKMSVEAYLQHEAQTNIRHEYIDGDIFAMTGGSERDSRITANTIITIGQTLRERQSDCVVHTSDMRVQISKTRFVYPDVSVVCGKAIFSDEAQTMLTNPTFVVEVISPSTANYDKGLKGDMYRSLSSLQGYLILAQERIHAQLYTPSQEGWLLREFIQETAEIALPFADMTLHLNDIYRGLAYDTE
jgi:Uma2 family endonuclease